MGSVLCLGKASQRARASAEVAHPTHAQSRWAELGSACILGPGSVVYLLGWGRWSRCPVWEPCQGEPSLALPGPEEVTVQCLSVTTMALPHHWRTQSSLCFSQHSRRLVYCHTWLSVE